MTRPGIDWRPMTEWPPKNRHHSDQFLFWQPAAASSRVVLSARAVVESHPPGPRATTRWARIDPPRPDEEVARERVVAALKLLGSATYLSSSWWGPRHEAARAAVLEALTGAKVPKSRAGFNAFRDALYAALGVDSFEGTPNAKENEFARRAAAFLAGDGG